MTVEQRMRRWEERRSFETLWWAGTLIWAGLIFGADSLGWLPQIGQATAWTWVFLGAGLYGLAGCLYRQTSVESLNPRTWDYVWSGFLLLAGLGERLLAVGADPGRRGLSGQRRTQPMRHRRPAPRWAQATNRAGHVRREPAGPGLMACHIERQEIHRGLGGQKHCPCGSASWWQARGAREGVDRGVA
jgi:hypothetical protein